MKLTIVLPSIKDRKGHYQTDFIEKMIPSMTHLRGLSEEWKISINFQLYTPLECFDLAKSVTDASRVPVCYIEKDYSASPLSMRRVRHDCAAADPESDIYVFIDDNVVFRPGAAEFYTHIRDYLVAYPNCGVVQCKSHFGGYKHRDEAWPVVEAYWQTDRSLFVRSLSKDGILLFPEPVLDIPGGLEDFFAVAYRLERGYYGARVFNSPIHHRHPQSLAGSISVARSRTSPEHDIHLLANNVGVFRYIADRWGSLGEGRKWESTTHSLPAKLLAMFNANCKDPTWRLSGRYSWANS